MERVIETPPRYLIGGAELYLRPHAHSEVSVPKSYRYGGDFGKVAGPRCLRAELPTDSPFPFRRRIAKTPRQRVNHQIPAERY
jgi:hypothetical protein